RSPPTSTLFPYTTLFRSLSPETRTITISISATAIAKKQAGQNPLTSNFDPMILSDSIIINTVIIKDTNPNVSQFKGKVNNRRIQPTTAFTKPITIPVTNAQPKPATLTPGITQEATATTRPVSKRLKMNLIILKCL